MPRLPTLPGELVPPVQANFLRGHVATLLGLHDTRFPGSQPVSFKKSDLQRLEREDYWVCEKSDGIRVLILILLWPSNEQEIYLIDRKNDYRQVQGLYFPHFENPRGGLGTTLLDGELVLDLDDMTGRETLRLLCFDCIAVNGQNIMQKTLTSRYGKLQEWVYKPFAKMIRDIPGMAASLPFDIKVKRMDLSYTVEHVLKEVVPKLQHGHDGLIYTCATSKYVNGTDERILKWKPPSENSVDFKLELRFPPSSTRPGEPDMHAKPRFVLMQWTGGSRYEFYDTMYVDDDEWERMKQSREQYDDRVVEVVWDFSKKNWKILRFRDDKTHGNHKSTVESVIGSIIDGVEVDELTSSAPAVRAAWKGRATGGQGSAQQPPPAAAQPASISAPHQPTSAGIKLMYTPALPSEYTKVGGPAYVVGMSR